MFGQIIARLDGSSFAEEILPLARCLNRIHGRPADTVADCRLGSSAW